jgi:adenylate cyclase
MGWDVELRFLVCSSSWKNGAQGTLYRQGYLSTAVDRTVRVRIIGEWARLTVKGRKTDGAATRFDYEIPLKDAEFMLVHLCLQPILEKTRYKLDHRGVSWDIDEFHGANEGLVIAEVELGVSGTMPELPEWVGDDVTEDHRYASSRLAERPFTSWSGNS